MTLVFVISGVKVSMFTCGMTLVFVASLISTQHEGVKAKTG